MPFHSRRATALDEFSIHMYTTSGKTRSGGGSGEFQNVGGLSHLGNIAVAARQLAAGVFSPAPWHFHASFRKIG
jgi:hypothetical protein